MRFRSKWMMLFFFSEFMTKVTVCLEVPVILAMSCWVKECLIKVSKPTLMPMFCPVSLMKLMMRLLASLKWKEASFSSLVTSFLPISFRRMVLISGNLVMSCLNFEMEMVNTSVSGAMD